jgi:DNA primase
MNWKLHTLTIKQLKSGMEKEHAPILRDLLDDLGVEYVDYGKRLQLRCLFHSDTTPSASVYEDDTYYCFGCNEPLNPIAFYAKCYGIPYRDAAHILSQTYESITVESRLNWILLKHQTLRGESALRRRRDTSLQDVHYAECEKFLKILWAYKAEKLTEEQFKKSLEKHIIRGGHAKT